MGGDESKVVHLAARLPMLIEFSELDALTTTDDAEKGRPKNMASSGGCGL